MTRTPPQEYTLTLSLKRLTELLTGAGFSGLIDPGVNQVRFISCPSEDRIEAQVMLHGSHEWQTGHTDPPADPDPPPPDPGDGHFGTYL